MSVTQIPLIDYSRSSMFHIKAMMEDSTFAIPLDRRTELILKVLLDSIDINRRWEPLGTYISKCVAENKPLEQEHIKQFIPLTSQNVEGVRSGVQLTDDEDYKTATTKEELDFLNVLRQRLVTSVPISAAAIPNKLDLRGMRPSNIRNSPINNSKPHESEEKNRGTVTWNRPAAEAHPSIRPSTSRDFQDLATHNKDTPSIVITPAQVDLITRIRDEHGSVETFVSRLSDMIDECRKSVEEMKQSELEISEQSRLTAGDLLDDETIPIVKTGDILESSDAPPEVVFPEEHEKIDEESPRMVQNKSENNQMFPESRDNVSVKVYIQNYGASHSLDQMKNVSSVSPILYSTPDNKMSSTLDLDQVKHSVQGISSDVTDEYAQNNRTEAPVSVSHNYKMSAMLDLDQAKHSVHGISSDVTDEYAQNNRTEAPVSVSHNYKMPAMLDLDPAKHSAHGISSEVKDEYVQNNRTKAFASVSHNYKKKFDPVTNASPYSSPYNDDLRLQNYFLVMHTLISYLFCMFIVFIFPVLFPCWALVLALCLIHVHIV